MDTLEPLEPLNLNPEDPFVAVLTWGLTWGTSRLLGRAGFRRHRRVLPLVAVLLAAGIQAGIVAVRGEAMSLDVVARGLGAAAVAVLMHSQARALVKASRADADADTEERPR